MTDMPRIVPSRPASPGAKNHVELSDTLRLMASRGQLEAVKDVLAAGAGLEPDRDGRNALHYAAQNGHAEMCKYLAAHGSNINKQDVMGYSPLLKAASLGAVDVVQVLLDAGCDTNIQDEHGNAAIHEACWNGFSKTAELLVKYNCNVFLENKASFTALHLAAQNGHNESSRILLYAGCNPDLKNNYGDTALHTAARYGHAGVARILISAKCKLSEQNKNGDTALHIAAALKRRKIAKILVESRIDVELVNKQNERAVDVARRKEHSEILLIISTFSKPPTLQMRQDGGNPGASLKEEITLEDGPVVCPADGLPIKTDYKNQKQEKERRFFFFKKKKKEKDNVKPCTSQSVEQKKARAHLFRPTQGRAPVHGFFSQYVPHEGVQLYRDLAGNIKQGPIGYAPVCQCGPSLKRLENSIVDTRDSLYHHIDTSHHALSQRIDNLDKYTKVYATEAMMQDKFNNESHACQARISERLHEERLETQAIVDQASAGMKEQLEYWLSGKLASYGHCLDHHHDDSALPPRNLFSDFSTMGRLVRSKSDETLSASDCSGKFRKKDFYASRQAAMQQIRGWDIPIVDRFSNTDRPKQRERNNNNPIPNYNRVITHAEVHASNFDWSNQLHRDHQVLSQSTLPETLNTGMSTYDLPKYGSVKKGLQPEQQTDEETPCREIQYDSIRDRSSSQSKVTFSMDTRWQQSYSQFQSPHRSFSPPSRVIFNSVQDQTCVNHQKSTFNSHLPNAGPQQQTTTVSHYPQQNLLTGGPPNTNTKSGEQEGSQNVMLTGLAKGKLNTSLSRGVYQRLTRHKDGYDGQRRTPSTDSLFQSASAHSQNIPRCHSVENTLEEKGHNQTEVYNSGYVTDSALRSCRKNTSSNNYSQSVSPASHSIALFQVPGTVIHAPTQVEIHGDSYYNQLQQKGKIFAGQDSSPTVSLAYSNTFLNQTPDFTRGLPSTKVHDDSRECIFSKTQHKSLHSLNDINVPPGSISKIFDKGDSVRYGNDKPDTLSKSESSLINKTQSSHFSSPIKECLQHRNQVSSTSPCYKAGNKEESSCSSNQDSGYSSHNTGNRKRGGTPSSSFSLERSACNTPNNAALPLAAQGKPVNSELQTSANGHLQQPYTFDNANLFPSDPVLTNSNLLQVDFLHPGNKSEGKNYNSKPLSSYSYPHPRSDGEPNQSNSFAYNTSSHRPCSVSNVPRNSSPHNRGNEQLSYRNYSDINASFENAYHIPKTNGVGENERLQTNNNNTNSTSSSLQVNTIVNHPPPSSFVSTHQAARERNFEALSQTYKNVNNSAVSMSNLPSRDTFRDSLSTFMTATIKTANSQDHRNARSVPLSEVQAHIQRWYQQKLMEAAQRLRQNYGYHDCSHHIQKQESFNRPAECGICLQSQQHSSLVYIQRQSQTSTLKPIISMNNSGQQIKRYVNSTDLYQHRINAHQHNAKSFKAFSCPGEKLEQLSIDNQGVNFPNTEVFSKTETLFDRTNRNNAVPVQNFEHGYNISSQNNICSQSTHQNQMYGEQIKGSDV